MMTEFRLTSNVFLLANLRFSTQKRFIFKCIAYPQITHATHLLQKIFYMTKALRMTKIPNIPNIQSFLRT